MPKRTPPNAKPERVSESSRRAGPRPENDELIVTSAKEGFAHAKTVEWPENFPKSDDQIDLSDIPEQDWSGSDVVHGKYRELALAAQGFVQLDSDVRAAFPDTKSVNNALRGFLRQRQRKTS